MNLIQKLENKVVRVFDTLFIRGGVGASNNEEFSVHAHL